MEQTTLRTKRHLSALLANITRYDRSGAAVSPVPTLRPRLALHRREAGAESALGHSAGRSARRSSYPSPGERSGRDSTRRHRQHAKAAAAAAPRPRPRPGRRQRGRRGVRAARGGVCSAAARRNGRGAVQNAALVAPITRSHNKRRI